jgi:3-oxoacyl-[acyl-carrier-protein] synthase II
MGIVSPIGVGVKEFARRMFSGDSGVVNIRGGPMPQDFPIPMAGLVAEAALRQPVILRDLDAAQVPKLWRFAALATEEAVRSLPAGARVDGVIYATKEDDHFELIQESFRSLSGDQLTNDETRAEASLEIIRRILDAHGCGPVAASDLISINNHCVSSNQAIGIAFERVRSGRWRRAVVGGVEAACSASDLMNFHLLHALSTLEGPAASCPFTSKRAGFVRAEGAATLVLENGEDAEARGATIYGYITGYGASSDAFRLTDGRSDGRGAIRAMQRAILDAGQTPDAVSAVSAHGTSTPLNDRLETMAIKQVFGSRAYQVPTVSLKSQIGHTLVAAGAIEAVACLLMLSEQKLAPTINCSDPDPDCDLDYVRNTARPAPLKTILSNNFGFGGQNACVLFERGL